MLVDVLSSLTSVDVLCVCAQFLVASPLGVPGFHSESDFAARRCQRSCSGVVKSSQPGLVQRLLHTVNFHIPLLRFTVLISTVLPCLDGLLSLYRKS
jgi:hypothetical protein